LSGASSKEERKAKKDLEFFVHESPLLAIGYPALKKISKHPKSMIMTSDVSIGSRSK
jgi:hypothetical protein